MTDSQVPPASRTELEAVLAAAEQLFALGGPTSRSGLARAAADWHGEVLAVLNEVDNLDPARWLAQTESLGLHDAAGVRALLRLSAAMAVVYTARYALGLPGSDGQRHTGDDIIREITATQNWLM